MPLNLCNNAALSAQVHGDDALGVHMDDVRSAGHLDAGQQHEAVGVERRRPGQQEGDPLGELQPHQGRSSRRRPGDRPRVDLMILR